MEVIIGKTPEGNKYRLIDLDTGKDISFVWAADDEAGLYAELENDGKAILATNPGTPDAYIESITHKGSIKLVKTEA